MIHLRNAGLRRVRASRRPPNQVASDPVAEDSGPGHIGPTSASTSSRSSSKTAGGGSPVGFRSSGGSEDSHRDAYSLAASPSGRVSAEGSGCFGDNGNPF